MKFLRPRKALNYIMELRKIHEPESLEYFLSISSEYFSHYAENINGLLDFYNSYIMDEIKYLYYYDTNEICKISFKGEYKKTWESDRKVEHSEFREINASILDSILVLEADFIYEFIKKRNKESINKLSDDQIKFIVQRLKDKFYHEHTYFKNSKYIKEYTVSFHKVSEK